MDILNKLTMNEISMVEQLSGQGIRALQDVDKPAGLTLAALGFVIRKRQPGQEHFTWNDAQALTFTEVSKLLGMDEDDDDEEGDSTGSETPSPKRSAGSSKRSDSKTSRSSSSSSD